MLIILVHFEGEEIDCCVYMSVLESLAPIFIC